MDLQKNTVKSVVPFERFKKIFSQKKVQRISIGVIMFIIIYGFIASSVVPKKYNLNVGEIAPADITSPKEIVDEDATKKAIDEAKADVKKVYIQDKTVQQKALNDENDFFSKVNEIRKLSNIDNNAKSEKLKSESPINLATDDYMTAITANDADLKTLQGEVEKNLNLIFEQQIIGSEDDSGTSSDQTQDDLKSKKQDYSYAISNLKLNRELRDLGTNIGFALIKPNMVFDSNATNDKMQAAEKEVQPVKIKRNQLIVKKSEVITAREITILRNLGLLEQQKKIDFLLYVGIGVIVVLFEGLFVIYLYKYASDIFNDNGKLLLLGMVSVLLLLFAKFASVYNVTGYLIPMAFVSMLISILLNPRVALVLSIMLSGFIAFMTGYNIDILIIALIGGCAGAITVSKMHQRNDLLIAGLLVGLADTLGILGIGLINSADFLQVFIQSFLGMLNGALSAVFTLGLLPFCETSFGIVTSIKLLELSNPNQPVLKRLLFEAPGTYHHSILVGNLAEAAVDAIGGNSLLARVGSYYHDIGKLKRPYFFKENQISNNNPHDKIAPSLSTLIITSHIKDGIEIAKQYRLPGIIKDVIQQHHGTTLVKYFYIKAVNDNDAHDEVTETQFRYDGPKPQNRETAIVMLADTVEAAVRSIPSPSKAKIEETVKKLIKEKIEDGQLDECPITLKDINKITSAFLKALNGIYHDRVEYPETANNGKEGVEDVPFNR